MDTTNYTNPNANYFSTPDVPDVINSTNTANNSPLNLTSTPQDTTDYGAVASAVPDYSSIIAGIYAPTQAETGVNQSQFTLKNLMSKISNFGGSVDQSGQIDTTGAQGKYTEDFLKQFGYTGKADAFQQFQDVTSRLSGLKKEALAIPLRLQQEAQGRGVTAGGLAPIQTGQLRENAIQSLTLGSIAEAIQGNLTTASALAKDAVDKEFAPIQAELNAQRFNYEMNKDALERADKKRADALNFAINERARMLEEKKAEKTSINNIVTKLASFGRGDIAQEVAKAKTFDEAIALAGNNLRDPREVAELESIRLEQVLKSAQIRKTDYELKLLKEYGGLTPAQYADKIKEEQKAIATAKDEQEKNRLQADSLDKKIILLDSVLGSKAIDSVVGPTPLTRATGGFGGVVLRTFTGAPLQGALDELTGRSDLLIGQTEQFISKEFLDSLISTKAQGGSFGALTKPEQDALTASATFLGNRRVYSGKGEEKEVVGYNMSEKDFRRELKNIQDLAKKTRERAIGKSFDSTEQNVLDLAFPTSTSPAIYY